MTNLLEIRDLHKRYGTVEVLKGVDCSMRQGDVISIIGSSGSGKTTMLRCINMLEEFQGGTISIDGQEIGYETVGAGYTGFQRVLDIAQHLILPAGTLGLFFVTVYMRMTRAAMLEVSEQGFVKTARAKGLRRSIILRRHVFRNAMLPVLTLAGLQAGQLVGGAVLTETVFAWPGIGRLMFEALAQRDYNLLLGIFFVCAAMVLLFNLITDILYRFVDPRIQPS